MKHHLFFLALVLFTFMETNGHAEITALQSGPRRVSLLELYTSEGCSSCPPAEKWFTRLKNDSVLWKNFVPVAFHVNYWDNSSWRDAYSSGAYADRQREYAELWHSENIYTPELVSNGREGRVGLLPASPSGDAGILSASFDQQRRLVVNYTPKWVGKNWTAHVALLGFDLTTAVRGGENNGSTLQHDFTVLETAAFALKKNAGELVLPRAKPGEKGIAVWVTEDGQIMPVQAAGGWLR